MIVIAQSLGEYGGASGFGAGIQAAAYTLGAWVESVSPGTWVAIVIVIAALFLFSRRR
ncbi:MAG TPA: hypothetical protein VL309_04905 [Vicinamibacterales bacterium]|jgi:hypothetical protein|nr:hypothetical protein [Vicinamibacterales bacterium]